MNYKTQEALKLALEALEHEAETGNDDAYRRERDAIREALADSALERMAENERELGLDYIETVQQPYAQTAAYIKSTTNGRMHVDPVTGDVSIGKKQPAHRCTYPNCPYPCPDLPECRDAEQPAQQHDDTDLQDKDPELVEQPHCDDCGGFDPECPLAQPAQQEWPKPKFVRNVDGVPCITLVEHEYLMRSRTSPPASKPLPEDYTALEQALTRLQKRYADLEGRASKPLTDEQKDAARWRYMRQKHANWPAIVDRASDIDFDGGLDEAVDEAIAAHGIKE